MTAGALRGAIAAAAALVVLAGCGAPGDEIQAIEVPADWSGHALGLSPPGLRPLEKVAQLATPADGEVPVLRRTGEGEGPAQPGGRLRAMGPDGTVYEVVAPSGDVERLGAELARLGQDGASIPGGPALVDKGWSSGTDDRVRIHYFSTTYWQPAGVVSPNNSSWCSGTLIEDRLVLTAAHCLYDGYGNAVGLKFRSAQDGTLWPYGQVSVAWKYWDQGFINNNCHYYQSSGYTLACERYDWAVLVLSQAPRSSGGSTPGYMGFTYGSDSAVTGWSKFHGGYPGCGAAGAPAGCVDGSLWAQPGTCATGTFFNPVSGWNRNFHHGCDMSGGHSGGSLFSWTPGSGGPYVVATNIAQLCAGSACSGSTPNIAFRIDSWLYNWLLYWRSIY